MLQLAGYANRLSVRPGETIEFKVSSQLSDPYSARLVRVISADPNPAGPGLREEPVASSIERSYSSHEQPVHLGSFARIEAGRDLGRCGPNHLRRYHLAYDARQRTPARHCLGL